MRMGTKEGVEGKESEEAARRGPGSSPRDEFVVVGVEET